MLRKRNLKVSAPDNLIPSRKYVMARSIRKSTPQPEWAKSVVRLRAGLVLNQVAFGHAFHCSAMAVSRWERGVSEPPSHIYIDMGNLAETHCAGISGDEQV